MNKEIRFNHAVAIIAAVGIIATLVLIGLSNFQFPLPDGFKPNISSQSSPSQFGGLTSIQHFSSESDFKNYLEKSRDLSDFSASRMLGGMSGTQLAPMAEINLPAATGLSQKTADGRGGGGPERVSETNVQVAGIDEPDIVKTDGKEIYYSSPRSGIMPLMRDTARCIPDEKGGCAIPPQQSGATKNIRAFPLKDLEIEGKIEKSGNLLLKDNILAILPENNYYGNQPRKIIGYDVSDPKSPKEKWNADLKENNELVAARLTGDKIYIVTKKTIDENRPCPIEPMSINGKSLSIGCIEVYHPATLVPADVTYTVTALDAATGEAKDTTTFLGSSSESVVYMSPDSIFLTYYYPGDFIKFSFDFFKENNDLIPGSVLDKIEKLKNYDIGASAKMTEFSEILEHYQNSLSNDEKMKMENELRNRMEKYFSGHKRDLERTGIVKIAVDNLNIEASGAVAGKPLNQFSLDEYENHLRIATTVGQGWWGFGFGGTRDSANDVYVLDKELRLAGAVTDLGLEEKIYSARFIEDKGYLVTFRQIDPFFVLDLSDPQNPKKSGELKIPGYSSYLHPITKDKILGIGEENNQVKVSLFDVSSPENPREISKYNLDEYYSEISATHHAFLLDKKHQVFFLPGSKGGYIFSYANNQLKLVKTVADIQAKRALYINDLLYVIGEDKIIVLDENNWERVGELEL
ncbi:MAG: beta-propeller domain-containing protein [Candidatus Moranbacteria bacterium]|nr:beta-propeller domain-containing protein [Candidatus Moranbacteria bacterium]